MIKQAYKDINYYTSNASMAYSSYLLHIYILLPGNLTEDSDLLNNQRYQVIGVLKKNNLYINNAFTFTSVIALICIMR